MPELRKDPVVGRWVIIATERGKRPSDFIPQPVDVPEQAKNPFAEGNEHMTPPEIFAFRDPKSKANATGWQVRVVPNKFPALRIEGELDKEGQGMYDKMNGIGAHEVIIETPNPSLQLEQQTVEGIGARDRDLQDPRDRPAARPAVPLYPGLQEFRQTGRGDDWSSALAVDRHARDAQAHERKLVGAMQYYAYKNRSIYEDILKQEIKEGSRLVYENAGFVAFCPFASRFPFEVTIMPRPAVGVLPGHPSRRNPVAGRLPEGVADEIGEGAEPAAVQLIWSAPGRRATPTMAIGRPSTRISAGTSRFCRA